MGKLYIEEFEKRYKRITNISAISLICIIGVWLLLVGRINILLLLLLGVSSVFILSCVRVYHYNRNVERISNKFCEDFDSDFAIKVYEALLQKTKRKDYKSILFMYLYMLVLSCQFEKFKLVYLEHRAFIQKRMGKENLESLLEMFLSIQEDRSEYKQKMFQYTFSPYHNEEGNLPKFKECLRDRDKVREFIQLYELKEYEKVIEKIETYPTKNNYEMESYGLLKERCLYYLNNDYQKPIVEQRELLHVLKWKTLVETGKEYFYVGAEEIATMIKQDWGSK